MKKLLTKQNIIIVAVLIVAIVGYAIYAGVQGGSAAEFPSQTINIYVASSAGGGTDTWNRQIAALMEQELGGTINVSNMPDGGGSAAQANVNSAAHDGYTWLGVSETGCTWPALGSSKQTSKEYTYFVMGGSAGVICVPADSPYQNWGEFVDAAKANPGKLNVANSGIGKLWHLKAYIALGDAKDDVNHVPYKGSGPAIIGVLSNEADALACSIAEATEYILSGELRPLAMMEKESYNFEGYGEIEAVTKYVPSAADSYPLNQFLSFALPADTDPAILATITEAFKKVMASDEMKAFAEDQIATIYAYTGEEANKMVADMEATLCFLMKDLGLAKADFEALGITK